MQHIAGFKTFTKRHQVYATIEKRVTLPAEQGGITVCKRFAEGFIKCLAARGEPLEAALRALRSDGFILHRSTISRWRRGLLPNFNSFQFMVLAQYVGYKDFIELLNDESLFIEAEK